MPCLWQTGDQPLAPLPHTHGPKVPVPLLPGHVQQDRHPPLPHTHQAQGDSVRQRVLRQRVVREGAAVEDADCPAKEAATSATSASSSLRRQAFDRAFLRIRTPLTGRAPTNPCLRGGERVKDRFDRASFNFASFCMTDPSRSTLSFPCFFSLGLFSFFYFVLGNFRRVWIFFFLFVSLKVFRWNSYSRFEIGFNARAIFRALCILELNGKEFLWWFFTIVDDGRWNFLKSFWRDLDREV